MGISKDQVVLFKMVHGRYRVYIFPRAFESPADANPDLIATKFGICEMAGMLIVFKEDMITDQLLEQFTASLQVASDREITAKLLNGDFR